VSDARCLCGMDIEAHDAQVRRDAIEEAAKAIEGGCPTTKATTRPCFACKGAGDRVRALLGKQAGETPAAGVSGSYLAGVPCLYETAEECPDIDCSHNVAPAPAEGAGEVGWDFVTVWTEGFKAAANMIADVEGAGAALAVLRDALARPPGRTQAKGPREACGACGGSGAVIWNCRPCNGTGRTSEGGR
jgi:hypothetical protein